MKCLYKLTTSPWDNALHATVVVDLPGILLCATVKYGKFFITKTNQRPNYVHRQVKNYYARIWKARQVNNYNCVCQNISGYV